MTAVHFLLTIATNAVHLRLVIAALDYKNLYLLGSWVRGHERDGIKCGHLRIDLGGPAGLIGEDDSIAFGLDACIGYCPRHQCLTTVVQRSIGKLAFRSLDGAGELPVYDPVLPPMPTSQKYMQLFALTMPAAAAL
jgi:hypothetical protein